MNEEGRKRQSRDTKSVGFEVFKFVRTGVHVHVGFSVFVLVKGKREVRVDVRVSNRNI